MKEHMLISSHLHRALPSAALAMPSYTEWLTFQPIASISFTLHPSNLLLLPDPMVSLGVLVFESPRPIYIVSLLFVEENSVCVECCWEGCPLGTRCVFLSRVLEFPSEVRHQIYWIMLLKPYVWQPSKLPQMGGWGGEHGTVQFFQLCFQLYLQHMRLQGHLGSCKYIYESQDVYANVLEWLNILL